MQPLSKICVCDSTANSETGFVGIRCERQASGTFETRISFPLGFFKDKRELESQTDESLRESIFSLFSVLADESLRKDIKLESKIATIAEDPAESSFPMVAYLNVIRNFLDFGYITERDVLYKKGAHGKVSWGRTIKNIRPVIAEDKKSLVYLDLIARKVYYNNDSLITLVHKYCVYDALNRLGFLYGIEPSEPPRIEFDYELFRNTIHAKLTRTFNDRDLRLLADLARIVEFLEGHLTEDGNAAKEFHFGVEKFAPIWESMVDKIFGTVSDEGLRKKFNPQLNYVEYGKPISEGVNYQDEDYLDEKQRSTLRPDTIMVDPAEQKNRAVYILDSKYYKFGMTRNMSNLPGAESVCKQMAYAEFVERIILDPRHQAIRQKILSGVSKEQIYNAFIIPYCANNGGTSTNSANPPTFKMEYAGYIYGNWKDCAKAYHKIHCVLLDIKAVMRNYASNVDAQEKLAKLIKG